MSQSARIEDALKKLKLSWIRENYKELSQKATQNQICYQQFLMELLESEVDLRKEKSIARKTIQARFPVTKSLDSFDWKWPDKINKPQVEELFNLGFIEDKNNAVFIGGVGVGKSHFAVALGLAACQKNYRVLFTNTIEAINNLLSAQKRSQLKEELKKYQTPDLLILDEVGYLPIDKNGANLLFQIISNRYEKKSTLITTNKAYQDWAEIFHNDNTVTSAVLDRLLHHCETCLIEGPSYRMKQKSK